MVNRESIPNPERIEYQTFTDILNHSGMIDNLPTDITDLAVYKDQFDDSESKFLTTVRHYIRYRTRRGSMEVDRSSVITQAAYELYISTLLAQTTPGSDQLRAVFNSIKTTDTTRVDTINQACDALVVFPIDNNVLFDYIFSYCRSDQATTDEMITAATSIYEKSINSDLQGLYETLR